MTALLWVLGLTLLCASAAVLALRVLVPLYQGRPGLPPEAAVAWSLALGFGVALLPLEPTALALVAWANTAP